MSEKKVNYGVQGIEDLVSDLNNSKDQTGEGQTGAIAIPSRKATGRPVARKKGTARTSITLDPEVMGKLRYQIPCQVSSDPHERRNDLGAVSTIDSVKS